MRCIGNVVWACAPMQCVHVWACAKLKCVRVWACPKLKCVGVGVSHMHLRCDECIREGDLFVCYLGWHNACCVRCSSSLQPRINAWNGSITPLSRYQLAAVLVADTPFSCILFSAGTLLPLLLLLISFEISLATC